MTRVTRPLSMLLILALAAPAVAGPKEDAQAHITKAMAAHKEGHFDEALTELQAAYAIDPQPDLLYAIGQVHAKLGQCAEAIQAYQQYLATNPPEGPATATQEAITACQAQLPPPPPPEPAPAPAPAPPPAPMPPPPPPPAHAPWYRDAIGDGLVGAGVALGIGGLVVYTQARSAIDDAGAATTYQAQQDLVDTAHTRRAIALGLGIGGAALIAGGVVHIILHQRAESAPPLAAVPLRGGGLVSWTGRF